MSKFTLHKVNLKDISERLSFSKKLQDFESQFSYPLGDKRFFIVHGKAVGEDYFSFFEQMGEVYYFVAQDQGKVVGAGCAVLRVGPEGKYWYLCDFKIEKAYRNLGILEAMFKKYFFHCVMKSRKMIAVNMGNGLEKGNGLLAKTRKIFFMFNVKAISLNFHTFKKSELPEDWKHKHFTTNEGRKDLVLDGESMPLYHVSQRYMTRFKSISQGKLSDDVDVMFCLDAAKDNNDAKTLSGKGILLSVGFNEPLISTVEI